MQPNTMKLVYVITTRNEQKYWNRIGVGFVNRDGSLNVKLDAVPVDGEIHIRDYIPREERFSRQAEPAPPATDHVPAQLAAAPAPPPAPQATQPTPSDLPPLARTNGSSGPSTAEAIPF